MVRIKCDLKMHVRNLGYPLPLQIGCPKTAFLRRLHNVTATLTAYIFETKQDVDNWASTLTIRGASYIASKRHELWSTNSFKLDRYCYPPYVNYAFYYTARLCRRTSANGTQPNFAKRRTVNRANNLL